MTWYRVYTSPTPDGGRAAERGTSPVRVPAPASQRLFRPGRVWRSQSSQNLRSSSPGYSSRTQDITDDLNTIPDPRNSLDSLGARTPPRQSSERSDHGDEVAALTAKLINSMNHQTSLDDNLQRTRHELEAARQQISQFETTVQRHQELVGTGVLVQRSKVEETEQKLRNELQEERALRLSAEKQKKGMEMELENLTSSLFEEANNMVADARRDNANAERRSEQLKIQLRDCETLLVSHQQQLRELKILLEQLQQEREESEAAAAMPRTPLMPSDDTVPPSPSTYQAPAPPSGFQPVAIDQPLRFSQLIRPVLRMDIPAYDDFMLFLQSANRGSTSSRPSTSGSFGNGLNLMMGTGQIAMPLPSSPSHTPSSSTSNLNSTTSPTLPGSFNNDVTSSNTQINTVLDKTKFWKRVLGEDIDPTLRLDAAPGLSFFARRTVVSSMLSGALVIEPWPPGSRYHSPQLPCSICGELRREGPYVRRHRFRTSDSDDAQRYPLCAFCLEKVRSTCELVGFMKLLKNGQWRNEADEEARLVRMAWEDCVKLRERMFWARIGGGVVPVYKAEEVAGPAEASQSVLRTAAAANGAQGGDITADERGEQSTQGESSLEAVEGAGTEVEPTHGPTKLLTRQETTSSEQGETFVDAPESTPAQPLAQTDASLATTESEDSASERERAVASALQ